MRSMAAKFYEVPRIEVVVLDGYEVVERDQHIPWHLKVILRCSSSWGGQLIKQIQRPTVSRKRPPLLFLPLKRSFGSLKLHKSFKDLFSFWYWSRSYSPASVADLASETIMTIISHLVVVFTLERRAQDRARERYIRHRWINWIMQYKDC